MSVNPDFSPQEYLKLHFTARENLHHLTSYIIYALGKSLDLWEAETFQNTALWILWRNSQLRRKCYLLVLLSRNFTFSFD